MKLFLITLIAIFFTAEIGTEVWYRWHEKGAERNPPWSFRWPDDPASPLHGKIQGFQEFPVAGVDVLHFDRARGGAWRDDAGNQWIISVLEWNPGAKVSAMDSRHNPMICLPSTGMVLDKQLGEVVAPSDAGPVKFQGYQFEQDGKPVYVFSSVIRPLKLPEGTYRSGKWERRITQFEKALNGNRQSPERIVLIAIQGSRSPKEAEDMLQKEFPSLVRPVS